ncbi:zinc finger protein zat11 [Phtheirospermum japonicum]|uniref:Zinc finger protein zat11 n=1 Tax=Phtheirospermum japonicum TaxID=374723 RepID=A0A830CWM4_9LAMI|nr:zinc finger protein zat11 [Phtheirospermum japonicum]
MMKRNREGDDENNIDITAMAKCLVLLSGRQDSNNINRVFTCKTCHRQFTSFQALGGHRASHKKPRLAAGEDQPPLSPPKPKSHECSICGLEFPIGQALGGHMRRHRSTVNIQRTQNDHFLSLSPPQVVKKLMPNNRRVLCLDLNLTPLENKFVFGKVSHVPFVDFI